MDRGGAHQQAEIARVVLVVGKRGPEGIADLRPGLARDQSGGGDVPLKAPAQGRHQIGPIIRDHRDSQGNRIGLFDRGQIGIFLGQGVGRHPRSCKLRARAGVQRVAIEPRTLPCHRDPFLTACRGGEHPE